MANRCFICWNTLFKGGLKSGMMENYNEYTRQICNNSKSFLHGLISIRDFVLINEQIFNDMENKSFEKQNEIAEKENEHDTDIIISKSYHEIITNYREIIFDLIGLIKF